MQGDEEEGEEGTFLECVLCTNHITKTKSHGKGFTFILSFCLLSNPKR